LQKTKDEIGEMKLMTWKTKITGLAASLTVLAAFALSSSADSWCLGLLTFSGHGH
jgi:hypothetical protein